MPRVLPKLTELRRMLDESDLEAHLEIDGGISPKTAAAASGAGANVLVAGSAVFKANTKGEEASFEERVASYRTAIAAIRTAAQRDAA